MSFEQAYEEFEKYAKSRHKKQGFYNLTHDFKFRVLPYFKEYDIFKITKKDLMKWKETIFNLKFSNSYNKRLYYVFNKFLDYCCTFYDLPVNLLRELGTFPKRVENSHRDYYTLKEFKRFIKCFDNIVYKSYFTFLFFTGCRPSEAMALKFSSLNGHYAIIEYNLQRKGKRELDTLKNEYSYGKVLLPKFLLKELKILRKYYIKIYGCESDYFIFGGQKPLAPTTIDRYKKKACKLANIRAITQHQFRHSYATYLTSKGIPINVVSKMLRHGSVDTTTKVYIHQDLTQEKRVLKTLNSNFFCNLTHDFKKFLLKH